MAEEKESSVTVGVVVVQDSSDEEGQIKDEEIEANGIEDTK